MNAERLLYSENSYGTMSFCVHPYNRLTAPPSFLRTFLAAAMLLICCAGSAASDWNMHWIHHPGAADDEQVWFRRTFTGCGKPGRALIEVASAGRFVLYVNGYNVSTDVLVPDDGTPAGAIRIMRYEVTRFLRPDTNVVAVWYSPRGDGRAAAAGGGAQGVADGKQLSLSFYGSRRKERGGTGGTDFAYVTDGTWLCRTNGCRTAPDGCETDDGTGWRDGWNAADGGMAGWLPADITADYRPSQLTEVPPLHTACRITGVFPYFLSSAMRRCLVYECGRRFYGMVRVTLRGMRRGDVISIGGLRYVCSGDTDEQACRRFTAAECGTVMIEGGPRLSAENIMSVEGLCIGPYFHGSWMY